MRSAAALRVRLGGRLRVGARVVAAEPPHGPLTVTTSQPEAINAEAKVPLVVQRTRSAWLEPRCAEL
jgi:hypothetical protein